MVFNICGHGGHFSKQTTTICRHTCMYPKHLQIFSRNLVEIGSVASEKKSFEMCIRVTFKQRSIVIHKP